MHRAGVAVLGLAILLATAGCGTRADRAGAEQGSAATPASLGMVDIRDLVPDIDTDIRYAGPDNFTGAPVEGYEAPKCYLLRPAAEALAALERELRPQGLRLRIFDCYRPARRCAASWNGPTTLPTSARARRTIRCWKSRAWCRSTSPTAPVTARARRSTHPAAVRGAAGHCTPLDMGTPFDFSIRAPIPTTGPGARASVNRHVARNMERHGFANYPMEWWHTFRLEPEPAVHHDVPIR